MENNDTLIKFSAIIAGIFVLVLQSIGLRKVNLCTEAVCNQEALMLYEVVPKIFKKFPPHSVKVTFADKREVDYGSIFSVNDIEKPPLDISWPIERKYERAKSRFALGMIGPDLPTREVAIGRYQWQHWLVIDIPGNKWKEGRTVTEYRAYEPFYINDLHRVFFLVWRQKGKSSLNYTDPYVSVNASDDLRGYFSWDGFSAKYNLTDIYAINFLQLNCTGTEPIMGFDLPTLDDIQKNVKEFEKEMEKEAKKQNETSTEKCGSHETTRPS